MEKNSEPASDVATSVSTAVDKAWTRASRVNAEVVRAVAPWRGRLSAAASPTAGRSAGPWAHEAMDR